MRKVRKDCYYGDPQRETWQCGTARCRVMS